MTTQNELRAMPSYADIHRVAAALVPADVVRGSETARWRETWATDTMHALGWYMADMMRRADVKAWDIGTCQIRRVDSLITAPPSAYVYQNDNRVAEYSDAFYVGPRDHYGEIERGDPELIRGWMFAEAHAALFPDMAGWCGACNGPIYWDGLEETHACEHCGAMSGACEDGCLEVGADICFHHGYRTVPTELLEYHDGDWEMAAAEHLRESEHNRAVATAASGPAGIWNFPNGQLDTARGGA